LRNIIYRVKIAVLGTIVINILI